MNAQAPAQVKFAPTPVSAVKPAPAGLASHTCACGGSHGLGDECAECRQKRLRVQRCALKAPDLFEMQLKSSASAALNYHFGRVSVTQAHSRQSGDGQEAHDEQEADRAAAQLMQGSEARVSQSTTPFVIRRRALDEDEEASAESVIAPEPEVTESASPPMAEATPAWTSVRPAFMVYTNPWPKLPAPASWRGMCRLAGRRSECEKRTWTCHCHSRSSFH